MLLGEGRPNRYASFTFEIVRRWNSNREVSALPMFHRPPNWLSTRRRACSIGPYVVYPTAHVCRAGSHQGNPLFVVP